MSHSVEVTLIADQEIDIRGKRVNIHDIRVIYVNADGKIVNASVEKTTTDFLLEQ